MNLIIRFKSIDNLFNLAYFIVVKDLYNLDFDAFNYVDNFIKLKILSKTATVQNILLISPFIIVIILVSETKYYVYLSTCISSVLTTMLKILKLENNFNFNNHINATYYILGFL